ncbi:MAG: rhomboid family intramembrane serine protease [Thermodesulfobacteriota bacterium]
MSDEELHSPTPFENEEDLTVVAFSPDYRQMSLFAMVLEAAGIESHLARRRRHWLLETRASEAPAALAELAGFEEENRCWPPPEPQRPPASAAPLPTVALMGLLVALYAVTGAWQDGNPWFDDGAVIRNRIKFHGEWWRLVTGLTLHADLDHLFGNVLIGGIIIHLFCRQVGPGLGWSLIWLAGILGNWLNVVLRDAEHLSVGFSTAVFGVAGLLAGMAIWPWRGWRRLLLPLGAGSSLLALLGTGGERTDLGAHLWGFASGIVLGILVLRPALLARLRPYPLSWLPWLWAAFTAYCWKKALG